MSHDRLSLSQSLFTTPLDRRRFLEVTRRFGFTVATVVAASGTLFSDEAVAQTAAEEQERQAAAKLTMTFATPYRIGTSRAYPMMQRTFKENVQNFTRWQVYVKLVPAGQLGVETELASKVQNGTIQVAQHSISNFSPFAPVVDLINLPYWCGENQKFVNLVTSKSWQEQVNPMVNAKGFKVLWYVTIDPRVVALRKGNNHVVRTPKDIAGIKFRVPASKILAQFYRLVGANPVPISWGETSTAIKEGVADALDPSVEALFVFGFRDLLSSISFIKAVEDGQVYSCNLAWFNGLPKDIQEGIEFASEVTMRQNLAQVPAGRAYAMAEMSRAGVSFNVPTKDERAEWQRAAGHQRKEWDQFKIDLAGSLKVFDKLLEAANTQGRYYVHDV